jgi:TPR repeat protein
VILYKVEMISLPLILSTIIFSALLTSCAEHRSVNAVAAIDPAAETETLLASAERGAAEDQYNLGMRYERGISVTQSYLEAVHWYQLAAMQGYREGQYKLCEMSERGQGLPQDYQEALRWCGLAAEQGHGRAMFIIGRLYHTAHGVPNDLVRAHMWYNLATAHGYEDGKKWRDRIADEMSASEIAEAQKLAREWNVKMGARNS